MPEDAGQDHDDCYGEEDPVALFGEEDVLVRFWVRGGGLGGLQELWVALDGLNLLDHGCGHVDGDGMLMYSYVPGGIGEV